MNKIEYKDSNKIEEPDIEQTRKEYGELKTHRERKGTFRKCELMQKDKTLEFQVNGIETIINRQISRFGEQQLN